MKVFFGGHTVTLGNVISDIGLVSIVVLIGLSDQFLKATLIKWPAIENPVITTRIQNTLVNFLDVEIYTRPCIVEDSKNCLKSKFMVTLCFVEQ